MAEERVSVSFDTQFRAAGLTGCWWDHTPGWPRLQLPDDRDPETAVKVGL